MFPQGLQRLLDISWAVPAVSAHILNAGSLQRNIALLSMNLEIVIQQAPERIGLALACRVMDGRPVIGFVLNKRIGSLLYQVPSSEPMPAEGTSVVLDSTLKHTLMCRTE